MKLEERKHKFPYDYGPSEAEFDTAALQSETEPVFNTALFKINNIHVDYWLL